MPSVIYRPVLVINAAYEPVSIQPVRYALSMMVKSKAVMVEDLDVEIRPGLRVPSVIRLEFNAEEDKYRHSRMPRKMLSRKNIYIRDHFKCQYCGTRPNPRELTLDHVTPKSLGGRTAWENLVACCRKCNHAKGNKTLAEAGLSLLHPPRELTVHTHRHLLRRLGLEEDERWGKYLYA
jgi:5-methylcytosine-specific restriction endonuclease McrA